jgi:hypothetical protein
MKTRAIPVSLLQSPSGSLLAARLPDFVTLTKPRVMALTVFSALVRMITASGHLDPLLVLNMWCDTDIDADMTRCPPAGSLIDGADRRQTHHEPRADQAPRRPIVASAPR